MSRYARSKSQRSSSARRNLRSRRANSAIPGYDNLGWDDFGHPASADQPDLEEYGIDSDFGEGVRKGPYPDSPAPASYAWEPDHPASKSASLRDRKLRRAMERKAAKCIKIAESRLGKFASQREIEDLALRFMDLPNNAINSRVASLDHDVMADEDDVTAMHDHFGEELDADEDDIMGMHDDDLMADDDDILAMMGDLDAEDHEVMAMHDHFGEDLDAEDHEIMAMMDDLDAEDHEVMGMHDHFGEDLDAEDDDIMAMMDEPVMGMHDHDLMADDDDVMGMHDHFGEDLDADDDDIMAMMDEPVAHDLFDEYDLDMDDMISPEEFGGSMDAFNAMDTDLDGFLSRDEVSLGLGHSFEEDDAAEALSDEITMLKAANARLARKVRRLSVRMAAQEEASEDKESEELEAEEKEMSKKASTQHRLARIERLANALSDYMAEMERQASEDEASEDEASEEEASEEKETSKKAYESMADVLADLEVEAEETEAEDPMGLDASDLDMIDPKLASIFTASDDDDEEDEDETEDAEETEDEEEEEKETSKKASYRPSKRTRQASVKTLGNISREASSSDELSKLWESAPDVSKFFG